MTPCPDPSVLEGLFQGTLAPAQRVALEHHLDTCHACSQTLSELARLFGSASWGGAGASLVTAATIQAHTAGPAWANPTLQSSSGDGSSDLGAPTLEFGRYQLGARLGVGGMGVVFEAHDPELDRHVALKLLHPGSSADAELTRARLMREAQAMARLAHPNVVAVYDVGRAGEQVFLAMELVEGSTLTAWLEARPSRTTQAIVDVFVAAGRGLEAAHAVGLVHRDFKPDNVLVGMEGRARVTDFGLALPVVAEPDRGPMPGSAPVTDMRSSTTVLTERGAIVGTPAYMAPEQWQGLPADTRTDQFSFCVALYEALFEVRPFAGDSVLSLSANVLEQPPQPAPHSAPRWLREVLARGLAKDPAARYTNMTTLLELLERDRKRALRIGAVVGAMGLGVAATVAGFAWMPADTPASTKVAAPADAEPSTAATLAQRQRCEADAAVGRGSWNAARRGALVAHLSDMSELDDNYRQQLDGRVLPVLDTWIEAWATPAKQACAGDGHTPLDRCLDAKLARFDALVQRSMEHSGYEIASALPSAALRLPGLDTCTTPAQLAVLPAAPSPEQVAKAKLLRSDIAAVEALTALERWGSARDEADHVIELAEALGYAPLLAEAQLVRGRIAADEQLPATALVWLEAAAETAGSGVHERVFGEAAVALIATQGAAMLQPEHAQRWQRAAESLAQRLEDRGLGGATKLAQARMLAAIGEYTQALEAIDDAEPELIASSSATPLRIRLSLERAQIKLALADLEGAASAATLAQSQSLTSLGPHALLHAEAKATRARILLARGDLEQAESLAADAVGIPGVGRSIRHDYDRGIYLGLSGDICMARGEFPLAREHYERAKTYFYEGPEQALPLVWLGALDIREGQLEPGLELLELALTKLEPGWGGPDPRRLALLRAVGLAQLEAGALPQARATLTAALSLADEALGFGPLLAFAQVDLAQVELAAGDRALALTLLDDAFVGMAGGLDHSHPRVSETVLTRADLAWALGKRDYASTLYRGVARDLEAQRGADDPATARAMARKAKREN